MFSFFVVECRSDAFENPVIQQQYRNLEALALDMMAPEDIEDLISKMQTNPLWLLQRLIVPSTNTSCNCLSVSLSFSVSVPKVDQMNQRLGPLVQEFKDLVYPPDYNPEGKPAAKRKTGQSSSHNRN